MYWFSAVPLGVMRGVLKGKTSKVVLGVVVLPYSAVAREMIWDLSELKSWLVARVVECMPGVDVFFVGKVLMMHRTGLGVVVGALLFRGKCAVRRREEV